MIGILTYAAYIALATVSTVLAITYLRKKMIIEMNVLQVHNYENEKMEKWFDEEEKREDFIREMPLLFAIIPLFIPLDELSLIISEIMIIAILIRIINKTINPNTKKPLVMTDRVKRMMSVSLAIAGGFVGFIGLVTILLTYSELFASIVMTMFILAIIGMSKITQTIIAFSNKLMKPFEAKINDEFYDDAKKKLDKMKNLKIIGITGSYGKTSTKYILSNILSTKYAVCKTPGSYNTLLGVIRTIREKLDFDDDIFVVEMGAKHEGDIKEIGDLVHQTDAAITAIGDAHLEYFKTIEYTKNAKFEIARTLTGARRLYVNIDDENIVSKIEQDKKDKKDDYTLITYSTKDKNATYYAENIIYNAKGSSFDIVINDKKDNNEVNKITIKTKLLGHANIYNILAAVAISNNYDVSYEDIKSAIQKMEPVEHRLQILKSASSITVIDDTFNSNPIGAKDALEVLRMMDGNKKYIITPGMIEMGDKEYDLNYDFALECIKSCDYTIMVGKKQTKAMQDAFIKEKVDKDKFYVAENLDDASAHLKERLSVSDVVLYENDMPEDR